MNQNIETESTIPIQNQDRINSVDILRGFDMFWITGGTQFVYALFIVLFPAIAPEIQNQFSHVSWNGFHFYDLIFPLFIFVMGVSTNLSIEKRKLSAENKKTVYFHILKRSLLLYLIGYLYYNILVFNLEEIRWLGVLQRIAICYFFSAILVLSVRTRTIMVILISVLISYWLMMVLIPVPGYGAGVLTPEGNLASYIDRLLLSGTYAGSELGDPEGILSTIPAIGTALIGVLASKFLTSEANNKRKVVIFLIFGSIFIIISIFWNIIFPINKFLWTSSFVLLTGGISLLLLTAFFIAVDLSKGKCNEIVETVLFPFRLVGSNSIFLYITTGLFYFDFLKAIPIFSESIGNLLASGCRIIAQMLILYIMYKKKWFLKI